MSENYKIKLRVIFTSVEFKEIVYQPLNFIVLFRQKHIHKLTQRLRVKLNKDKTRIETC